MKYFAIIDGEKRGPFELDQLVEAGVRPSTYVWCKGMADWDKAENVADICRMYRGRLYDLLHPKMEMPQPQQPSQFQQSSPTEDGRTSTRFDRMLQDTRLPSLEEIDAMQDISRQPANMLLPAIIVTLLFFPPLGIFAIYFAVASRRCWKKSIEVASSEQQKDSSGNSLKNGGDDKLSVKDWHRLAHEYARAAKMWTGITFFIGLILYGFLFSRIF